MGPLVGSFLSDLASTSTYQLLVAKETQPPLVFPGAPYTILLEIPREYR